METVAAHSDLVRSVEVIGVSVTNPIKEKLGVIYEIVIDKFTGQVAYAVLECNGFLGLGGKFLAIPWRALKYSPGEVAFLVSLTKKQLEEAPGFDEENWPKEFDLNWNKTISAYYDYLL